MTPEEYLTAAWLRAAPGADTSRGFPRGFWQDVARAAVEMALVGNIDAPLSFRQTLATRGNAYEEGRSVFPQSKVRGLDLSKLEFRL